MFVADGSLFYSNCSSFVVVIAPLFICSSFYLYVRVSLSLLSCGLRVRFICFFSSIMDCILSQYVGWLLVVFCFSILFVVCWECRIKRIAIAKKKKKRICISNNNGLCTVRWWIYTSAEKWQGWNAEIHPMGCPLSSFFDWHHLKIRGEFGSPLSANNNNNKSTLWSRLERTIHTHSHSFRSISRTVQATSKQAAAITTTSKATRSNHPYTPPHHPLLSYP